MFCGQMWNPLGIVGVITAFNFPCAVLGKFTLSFTFISLNTFMQTNVGISLLNDAFVPFF